MRRDHRLGRPPEQFPPGPNPATHAESMLLVPAILTVGLGAYGVFERRRHQRHLARIPGRVHVNGTRGKSSVTRLIAGGLRASGRRVFAKTTGTMARMIDPDGREVD